jgi:hypothetical protein
MHLAKNTTTTFSKLDNSSAIALMKVDAVFKRMSGGEEQINSFSLIGI